MIYELPDHLFRVVFFVYLRPLLWYIYSYVVLRDCYMFEALYNDKLKDLPVNEISDAVMDSVDNNVTIISSPTGSGKTLTIPAKLADKIPDNERVVVLVPRKFLAINAAETVSELSGGTLGEEVGYAVGILKAAMSLCLAKILKLFLPLMVMPSALV